MADEWRMDYNLERPHKSLGYLSPALYAEKYYQRLVKDLKLYPQAVTENHSQIEGNRFVDKELEKLENSNP